MKQSTKTITSSLLASMLFAAALMLVLSGVVSAQRGSDDRNNIAVSSETEDTEPEQEDDNLTDSKEAVRNKVQQLRAEAKSEIEAKRKNRETLSADKRMKVCENRKKAIDNKLSAYNNAADKHLTKLDAIYVKILAFQEEKQVVVSNIDELTTDADAKKLAATESVAALKTVAVDVDCSDPETTITLGTVRDAAQATRKALHEYRMSLKNIVVAIAQSQSDNEETDEGSSTTEQSNESAEATETTQEAN